MRPTPNAIPRAIAHGPSSVASPGTAEIAAHHKCEEAGGYESKQTSTGCTGADDSDASQCGDALDEPRREHVAEECAAKKTDGQGDCE